MHLVHCLHYKPSKHSGSRYQTCQLKESTILEGPRKGKGSRNGGGVVTGGGRAWLADRAFQIIHRHTMHGTTQYTNTQWTARTIYIIRIQYTMYMYIVHDPACTIFWNYTFKLFRLCIIVKPWVVTELWCCIIERQNKQKKCYLLWDACQKNF